MINKRFKSLREERHDTLLGLAEKVEIARSTLSTIENGKRDISTNHVEALCKYFEVSSDYLLGRSDDGIICHYYDNDNNIKDWIVNEQEMKEYERYIYVCSTGRMISSEGIEKINIKNEKSMNSIVQYFIDNIDRDYIYSILSKIPKLSQDNLMILEKMIDSWIDGNS